MNLSVSPISQFYNEDRELSGCTKGLCSPLDIKIQEFVSRQIKSSPGTLFATAILPYAIDLIFFPQGKSREGKSMKEGESQRKISVYPMARSKLEPIGLVPCDAFLPLNALMQLIIFIPAFREVFSFVSRSFHPISDFIGQYMSDQENNLPVSSADSNRLIQLLFHKLPAFFFRKFAETDYADFIFELVRVAFGKVSPAVCNSFAFRPQWHAIWNRTIPFSCAIDLPSRPPELFVTIQNSGESSVQRQFFTKPDSLCYDLDAFIECQEGDCAAYLKNSEGIWHRCFDSNIMAVRSTHLKMPLSRSVLLHYTRLRI